MRLRNEAGNPQGNKLPHEPPTAQRLSLELRDAWKQKAKGKTAQELIFPLFFLSSISPHPTTKPGAGGGSSAGLHSPLIFPTSAQQEKRGCREHAK